MKTFEQVKALFVYCGINVRHVWKIENQYWPESYIELRAENPWWLVLTPAGIVEIGPRKRVISVDWSSTDVCHKLETDNTVSETHVHAWDEAQLLLFLRALAPHFNTK